MSRSTRHLQGLRHPRHLPDASSTARWRGASAAPSSTTWARSASPSAATCGSPRPRSRPASSRRAQPGLRGRPTSACVGTDMLYYYVARHDLDGGAIITASHNPKEWNGIKMVRAGRARPLRRRRHQGDQGGAAGRPLRRRPGRRRARRARSAADQRRLRAATACPSSTPPRVPPAQGGARHRQRHGRGGRRRDLPAPAARAGAACTSSSTAPSPTTRPTRSRRRTAARSWRACRARRPTSASPGTATPTAASSSTTPAPSCPATSSPRCWARRSAARSRAPASCTTCAPRARCATAWRRRAARPLMHRVGHAFIKKRMRDENAVFGGEVSGHFYFRDNWYADNGMIPALLVLELLGRERQALQRAAGPAARALPHLGRDQLEGGGRGRRPLAPHRGALRATRAITKLDGISVDYDDWHFNVRPSNTEPLLRLNLEAYTPRRDGAPPRRGPGPHPRLTESPPRRGASATGLTAPAGPRCAIMPLAV